MASGKPFSRDYTKPENIPVRGMQYHAQLNQAIAMLGVAFEELEDLEASGEALRRAERAYDMVDKAIEILLELSPSKLRPHTRNRLLERHGK